ncbi:MAG: HAD hydrolase-like protein [Eubacteriales bacterium]
MVKLCVFDLDGTLVNTLHDLTNSLNYALTACGFPTLSESRVAAIVTTASTGMCEHACRRNTKTRRKPCSNYIGSTIKNTASIFREVYDGMIGAEDQSRASTSRLPATTSRTWTR